MHPGTNFSDSLSPNTQQHNIVQSQNKNSTVFPNSEINLPSQYNSAETPSSQSEFADTPSSEAYSCFNSHPSAEVSVSPYILRRSDRVKQKPSYLQGYHCKQVSSCSPQSASSVNNSLLSFLIISTHKHFCLSISSQPQSKFYHQAVKDPL